MRKTIRGLIVRGIAAAAVGIIAEVASSVKKPAALKSTPPEPVSEAEEWVRTVTHRAAQWAHDAEVSDTVREMCRKILASPAAERSEAAFAKFVDTAGSKVLHTFRRK